jgi:septum formation protein
MPRLVLASASPRRRELLARLGVAFEVVPSGIEERLTPGVAATDLVAQLARAKAADVARRLDPAVVLGADTLVVLNGRPLGKPGSRDEAAAMLAALGGRVHEVVTGVAVLDAGGVARTETVTSRVRMRAYDAGEIAAYVASGESDDKAGAYAAQGAGGRLVAAIEGSWTNVVGLPLGATARLLRAAGVPVAEPPPEPTPGRQGAGG